MFSLQVFVVGFLLTALVNGEYDLDSEISRNQSSYGNDDPSSEENGQDSQNVSFSVGAQQFNGIQKDNKNDVKKDLPSIHEDNVQRQKRSLKKKVKKKFKKVKKQVQKQIGPVAISAAGQYLLGG